MYRILIVDDEETVRYTLKQLLSKYGFAPREASDGAEAITAVKNHDIDLILLDLVMPGPDGMETLLELKRIDRDRPVIMMTGRGDISTAVQAIKMGAYDFITKPFQANKLIEVIRAGLERLELQQSVKQLQTSLEWIFGGSAAMRGVIQDIRQIAWGNTAIVIHGEAGAGKSVTAQVIHNLSKRAHSPFQPIKIDSISGPLIETELFGRGSGYAEGQDGARKGIIESARGGTVFICDLKHAPSGVQDRLLKAMEERRIYPGAATPVEIDVRVIIGADTDLRTLMRRKKLTEGLYRHLSGPVITLPPLRERMEDVRFLALKFLWKASIELNRQVHELDEDAMDLFMHHSWPGNVRELENTVRRAVLASEDGIIRPEQLKSIIEGAPEDKALFSSLPHKTTAPKGTLVAQSDENKEITQNAILANIKELIFPYLQKVRNGRLTDSQVAYMDMIESSLNHVISPFLQKMKGANSCFTPAEIQVADMIRNGKTSKEIAELLNVCTGTVEGHRINIRKKLGLSNRKINLAFRLSSM
jgi:DNA-binding NtrC family response regulator/DNA-binding CsgD family transcriptional regulator